MIQRIQTVYLFIAFLASTLLFFNIPVALFQVVTPVAVDMPFYIMSKFQNVNTLPLIILNGIIVALSFGAILLYNNRPLQYKLTMFAFLATVIFIILLFYSVDSMQKQLNLQAAYKIGIFMPLISLVVFILASKAIRKDEKLVKDTDRLR